MEVAFAIDGEQLAPHRCGAGHRGYNDADFAGRKSKNRRWAGVAPIAVCDSADLCEGQPEEVLKRNHSCIDLRPTGHPWLCLFIHLKPWALAWEAMLKQERKGHGRPLRDSPGCAAAGSTRSSLTWGFAWLSLHLPDPTCSRVACRSL